ncbi:MAG: regulatory protein RecX [Gemmatimonadota bacterium]
MPPPSPSNPPLAPIEALVADPKAEGSVQVMIDGRRLFSVPLSAVLAENLRPGQVLAAEAYARLSVAADQDAAYRTAVRLLGRRPFARRDLGRRLVQRGHPLGAVKAALERAASVGYLDDAEFARHYVQTRLVRGRGPDRLKRELGIMGIDRSLADAAIEAGFGDPAVAETAIERLVVRRLPAIKGDSAWIRRQKLLAYLARRGYRGEVARAVVERLVR